MSIVLPLKKSAALCACALATGASRARRSAARREILASIPADFLCAERLGSLRELGPRVGAPQSCSTRQAPAAPSRAPHDEILSLERLRDFPMMWRGRAAPRPS